MNRKKLVTDYSMFSTFVEVVQRRAHDLPSKRAYTFLASDGTEEATLTYLELDRRARGVAARLLEVGEPGDRAILLYPPGLEYVIAFLGCLYAGIVAVPAYPPRQNKSLPRLSAIVTDARPVLALTTLGVLTEMERRFELAPELREIFWIATDHAFSETAAELRLPALTPDAPAFLQYTSGSTAQPKGVVVTHQNLLHNERAIQLAFGHTDSDVIAGWLPLYHDMGLVGNMLQPLYTGASCVLMSPMTFLQEPVRWLQAISDYGATTSGGPNFAYDLCVRRISPEQRVGLDLTRWQVAFCGAEPVRQKTLENFMATFGDCGFHGEAFYPCYGLAEATLFVSGGEKMTLPVVGLFDKEELRRHRVSEAIQPGSDPQILVSSGRAAMGQSIEIVDPETRRLCGPDSVGEIWVAGPSVAAEYWKLPVGADQPFGARLAGDGGLLFLRTGDLGFLKDGQLFVTGRIKDLIIIRGRNYYPQDIEDTVGESHPSLRPNACAAFSCEVAGTERLVIVQEAGRRCHKGDVALVLNTIRRSVGEKCGLQAYAVVLVRFGTIPHTSSGKTQRRICREMYTAGNLDALDVSVLEQLDSAAQAGDEHGNGNEHGILHNGLDRELLLTLPSEEAQQRLEAYLIGLVAGALGVTAQQINRSHSLSALGIDSLTTVTIQHSVEQVSGTRLPLDVFLEDDSIAHLATELFHRLRVPNAVCGQIRAALQSAGTGLPLSEGQKALWFMHQLSPSNAAYNIAHAIRLQVSPPVLRRAFQELVSRHPLLRTTFGMSPEGPVQYVHEDRGQFFYEEDVWDDAELEGFLADAANRPFDLEAGPLFRAYLFRSHRQYHTLLVTAHHSVADLWSMTVLAHELGILCQAGKDPDITTPAPLSAQYADYVEGQRELLASMQGEQHWSYWKGRLSGELPVLNLPTDRPRPVERTYRGASHTFRLRDTSPAQIQSIARAEGTTVFSVLLAAFYVLLHRYTGQADIVVGSPTACRDTASFAGIVGYFVNPVALRADLSGDPTFATFVSQVARDVRRALANQHYPFSALVERLQPKRDLSCPPVFQVMFGLQQSLAGWGTGDGVLTALALGRSGIRGQIGGLPVETVAVERRGAQFDLTMTLGEVNGELCGSLEYSTDLFDAPTVERMASHFQTLLKGAVANPQSPISRLPLMTEPEREQLLVEWNATQLDPPDDRGLPSLFEAQVARNPTAIAVMASDGRLTYSELNARANRLAHSLRARGVGRGNLIGLCVSRSLDMVVGVLGILKAGAAYVPLDPEYPRERLGHMIDDVKPVVLLTQERHRAALPELGMPVITLDCCGEEISQCSDQNLGIDVLPQDLVYVIHTSGSTGRPKGVAIRHGGFNNLLHWFGSELQINMQDRLLLVSAFGFDLTQKNIFSPLLHGGQLHLLPQGPYDPSQIVETIAREEITLLNCTPSTFYPLVESAGEAELKSLSTLRCVVLGGEPVAPPRFRRWTASPHCRASLVNSYGPTECTDVVTFHHINPEDEVVPLGKPIPNTQVYVLDEQRQPVPVGMIGELHIGGAGLACEYLNCPDLTREKFVPNPLDEVADPSYGPGTKLYRTGDLARWRADGDLEFMGRQDHQVKVRGSRLELGEVESVLRDQQGVKEAVVVTCDDAQGQARLVAYIVGDLVAPRHLRQAAAEKLPEYMIPAVFMFLDALPQSPNGKLDRSRLPAPNLTSEARKVEYVAPRNTVEEALVGIWQQVLGVARVGIHDNFFELGGDSLHSALVAAKAGHFGLILETKQLFRFQTIAQLSPVVQAKRGLPCAEAATGPLPLSPAQHRFFENCPLDPSYYNAQFLIETESGFNPTSLRAAVGQLLVHHDALCTRFKRSDEVWMATIVPPDLDVPFLVINAEGTGEAEKFEATRKQIADAHARVDICEGPIFDVTLLQFKDGAALLLVVAHHLVVDTISWEILFDDLWAAYRQQEAGQIVRLPAAGSYRAWAEGQAEAAKTAHVGQDLEYWQSRPWDRFGPLPLDFPDRRDEATRASVQHVHVAMSSQDTQALLSTSRQHRVHCSEVLLAALGAALERRTGSGVFAVEIIDHGRRRIDGDASDVARTVGWFTAHYPLVVDLHGAERFHEKVTRVRLAREAVPSHGLSYGMLRYLAGDEVVHLLRAYPRPDVVFKFDGIETEGTRNKAPVKRISRGAEFGVRATSGSEQADFRLRVTAGVDAGRLNITLSYSAALFQEVSIKWISKEIEAHLQEFLAADAVSSANSTIFPNKDTGSVQSGQAGAA